VHNAEAVVLLPFIGVALILAVNQWSACSAARGR